jgi:hypothetical protein
VYNERAFPPERPISSSPDPVQLIASSPQSRQCRCSTRYLRLTSGNGRLAPQPDRGLERVVSVCLFLPCHARCPQGPVCVRWRYERLDPWPLFLSRMIQRTSESCATLDMSSASNISLTLVQQPTQSSPPTATSLYEDAVHDASVGLVGANNTLFLWETGCRSNQAWNCDQACSGSDESYKMVWNSKDNLSTLRNCLVYPLIATAASQGWLVQDPPGLLNRFGISPSDAVSVDPEEGNGTLEEAWPVVNDCIRNMCDALYGSNSTQKCLNYSGPQTDYYIGPSNNIWNPRLVSLMFEPLRLIKPADDGNAGFLDRTV